MVVVVDVSNTSARFWLKSYCLVPPHKFVVAACVFFCFKKHGGDSVHSKYVETFLEEQSAKTNTTARFVDRYNCNVASLVATKVKDYLPHRSCFVGAKYAATILMHRMVDKNVSRDKSAAETPPTRCFVLHITAWKNCHPEQIA